MKFWLAVKGAVKIMWAKANNKVTTLVVTDA